MISLILAGWFAFIIPSDFPDSDLLKFWNNNDDFTISRGEVPELIVKTEIQCAKSTLWPTHPQQFTKEYHFAAWAHYDHGRLSPDSAACLRANPTNRFCVMATYANAVVMSDTFSDECGNSYRGYWLVSYLRSDESMGTLFSKGRTVYPKPDAEFPGEFYTGDTYRVESSQFLFLSPITKEDLKQVEMSQTEAREEGYISRKFQWIRSSL